MDKPLGKRKDQNVHRKRIGILGGMGPLAGVELHRLIVLGTPASVDQEHIEVVLYTNPSIPDRSTSLRVDDGVSLAKAAGQSVKLLEKAQVDVIALACMTAHAKIQEIQAYTHVPILDGLVLAKQMLRKHYSAKKVALLATNGAINAGIYTKDTNDIHWIIPEQPLQEKIMEGIYAIKGGSSAVGIALIQNAMSLLRDKQEAEVFVFGCTELSLVYDHISPGYSVVDPLRLLAQALIEMR